MLWLPLILEGEDPEELFKYLLDRLRAHKELDATPTIGLIRRKGLEEGGVEISFVYNEPQASLGMYRTINTITISKAPSFDRPLFFATLVSQGGRRPPTGQAFRGGAHHTVVDREGEIWLITLESRGVIRPSLKINP